MKFALIGNSVEKSPSPYLHKLLFAINGIDADYEKIKTESLTREDYEKINRDFDGFNVTMPFKCDIIPYLTKVSTKAGAVNTVKKGVGYNTDIPGAEFAIRNAFPNFGGRVLILGNGGAARAVFFAVKRISGNASDVVFAVRSLEKAQSVSDLSLRAVTYDNVKPEYDYVINATSVGYKTDAKLLSDEVISFAKGVFDVVYSKNKTLLELSAEKAGIKYCGGLSMLAYQAAFAQAIWLTDNKFDDESFSSSVIPERSKIAEVERLLGEYVSVNF